MSEVKTEKLSPRVTSLQLGDSGDTFTVPSGATLAVASGATISNSGTATGFGKVLQVVQSVLTTETSTTSTSYVDLVTVSITPSATDSKIWCNFSTNGGTNGNVNHGYVILTRGDTEIFSATSTGSRTGASGVMNTASQEQYFMGGSFLDSPSTTSATTYKIRFKTSNSSAFYINRSARDTNLAAYDGRTPSQITVMEIAA